MSKRFALPLLAAVLLLAGAAAISLSGRTGTARAAAGDGQFVPHAGLVPSEPQTGYPRTLTTPTIGTKPRQSYAVDLIDGYMVSGGNFLNVEKQDRTVVPQEYLAIYDTSNKQLHCESLQVDGQVLSFAPGPQANTMIMGGKFNKVMGADGVWRTRNKIAMIHLDTCSVNTTWIVPGINGRVLELAVSGDRLFLGGDFTSVSGQPIAHLAEVDYNTAALNPAMNFTFQQGNAQGKRIVGLEANEDGTRLGVGHRAIAIDGISMRGTAIFNISDPANPTLTDHRMGTGNQAYATYYDIQDVAIDPNFTYFAIAQGTATVSDYVTRVNTGEAPDQFVWQHFMRDSSFTIAASNNAIYVGGHFCKIDKGPNGEGADMAPNILDQCTGTNMRGGVGAWRSQLAALNPVDGSPLEWNPGNDALVGARAMTVVSRGLLVGYDGTYTHGATTYRNVGTSAFFDFGDNGEVERVAPSCTTVVNEDNSVALDWDEVNGIDLFQVRRNDTWVDDAAETTFTDNPGPGTWSYEVRYRQGGVHDIECGPAIEIGAGPVPTCTAVLNGDGSMALNWDLIPGTSTYTVRKNGAWLVTVGDQTTYTDLVAGADPAYVVRSFNNGVVTDVICDNVILEAADDGVKAVQDVEPVAEVVDEEVDDAADEVAPDPVDDEAQDAALEEPADDAEDAPVEDADGDAADQPEVDAEG